VTSTGPKMPPLTLSALRHFTGDSRPLHFFLPFPPPCDCSSSRPCNAGPLSESGMRTRLPVFLEPFISLPIVSRGDKATPLLEISGEGRLWGMKVKREYFVLPVFVTFLYLPRRVSHSSFVFSFHLHPPCPLFISKTVSSFLAG